MISGGQRGSPDVDRLGDNTAATWSCTRGTSHERPGTPTSSAPNWPRQLSPGPRELEAGVPRPGVRARDPRAGECARLRSTGSLLWPDTRLGSRRLRHCPPSPSMSVISCGSYATLVASHPDVSTVHRHSDIGYHTPESVHDGLAAGIREQRAAVLEAAYSAHPERFIRGKPVWIQRRR